MRGSWQLSCGQNLAMRVSFFRTRHTTDSALPAMRRAAYVQMATHQLCMMLEWAGERRTGDEPPIGDAVFTAGDAPAAVGDGEVLEAGDAPANGEAASSQGKHTGHRRYTRSDFIKFANTSSCSRYCGRPSPGMLAAGYDSALKPQ